MPAASVSFVYVVLPCLSVARFPRLCSFGWMVNRLSVIPCYRSNPMSNYYINIQVKGYGKIHSVRLSEADIVRQLGSEYSFLKDQGNVALSLFSDLEAEDVSAEDIVVTATLNKQTGAREQSAKAKALREAIESQVS